MLASLLPGLRDLRTPLATGYLWLVALWLLLHDHLPKSAEEATGPIRSLYELGGLLGSSVVIAALSFVAYLLGSMLSFAPATLPSRQVEGRRGNRLARFYWFVTHPGRAFMNMAYARTYMSAGGAHAYDQLETFVRNAKQQADIVAILVWAHLTHGIPLRLCPGPNDPGIGWHIMWGAPGAWTPVSKVCPGPNRIKQIPALIERAENIVNSIAEPEDDMYSDADRARDAQTASWMREVRNRVAHVEAMTIANLPLLLDDEGKVTAKLAALPGEVATAVADRVVTQLPAGAVVDTAALSTAIATAAADEVAKRMAA